MKLRLTAGILIAALLTLEGCGLLGNKGDLTSIGKGSSNTGISWKDASSQGFTVPEDFKGVETPPGMVFVEGGTFLMSNTESDIGKENHARTRQVSVASFYIDEVEVSNIEYRFFLESSQGGSANKSLYEPDSMVWYRELAYNDPYISNYFKHPGFAQYPVVGVNWFQAQEYCEWRTKVVNEEISKRSKNPGSAVLYPAYRLPTEAEWEYAARGGLEQQLYAWEGTSLRFTDGKLQGTFRANLKRGRGDYAGRSSKGGSKLPEGLNDKYIITGPVRWGWPNDFGLYNMSGNVAEWVFDTYRLLSYQDVEDLNPARRRGKTTDPFAQEEPDYDPQRSLIYSPIADPGKQTLQQKYNDSPIEQAARSRGLSAATATDFDNVKVYRGGSWADLAYYLSVGTRRYARSDSASARIGFRCAMVSVGDPS